MCSLKLGLIAITVAGLLGSLAAAGCRADGGSADLSDDASATEPTAQLPPPSDTDSGPKDAAVTKDVDPPPPSPGDPCTKLDALATRRCGACGYQHARCRGEGDALKWSDYGVCEDEVAGGCVPGTVVTEACGNCGTVTKTCTQYCAYTGACGGEPPDSCKPGSTQYSTAGCTTPNTYTKRTCAASCTWASAECLAPNNPNKLTISDTLGQSVKTTYTLSSSEIGKRPDDVCSRAAVWHQNVPRVAVEIRNPTSKRATVTVYTSQASGGPEELDTVLWIYKIPMPPHDDDSLLACDYGLIDLCDDTSPSNLCNNQVGTSRWAGIPAVEIPAGGAVLVYIAGFHQWVTGPFALNVRTDNLL